MPKQKVHSRKLELLDKTVAILGVVNVFATLPQVLTVWAGKNAEGLSSISWGYYALFSATLLVYGVAKKERPIVIAYIGSTILYTAVFIGSLIY